MHSYDIIVLLTLILSFASDSCNNSDILLVVGYNYNIYMHVCICVYACMCSGRNKNQKLVSCFFEDRTFVGYLLPYHWKCTVIWPTKSNFGWPYVEIGQKMADGQLPFLALYVCMYYMYACMHAHIYACMYTMHVCRHMYMWMYVCTYVYVHIHVDRYQKINVCDL